MEWSNLDDVAGRERLVLFDRSAIENDRVLRPQREKMIAVLKLLDARLHTRHRRMIQPHLTLAQPADQQSFTDDRDRVDRQVLANDDELVINGHSSPSLAPSE